MGTEHLRQGEDEIGRGRARRQSARHLYADDIRLGKERRLSQHGRFGLDAADPPAQHSEAVDHRGVGVGPHQRVGECHTVAHAHDLPEMLQVHLVADPGTGGNDAEPVERLLSPSEERVPLTVAPVLPFDVGLVRVRRPEEIDLDRVIDDQVHGHERVHRSRIPRGSGDGAPHRSEVDDRRHSGEVLHQDTTRHERDVRGRLGPSCERADIVVRHISAAGAPKQVLEQDLDGVRQEAHIADPGLGEPRERVESQATVPGLQLRAGAGEFRSHPNGPSPIYLALISWP